MVGALSRLLDEAREGNGRSAFIAAEAGLGKTTLLGVAVEIATGYDVAAARGHAMETALPFSLLGQALENAGGHHPARVRPSSSNPGESRVTLYLDTFAWLRSRLDRPMLLALDDLHRSDDDSLALPAFLCRRIEALPVAVIGTLRPWPSAARAMCIGLKVDELCTVYSLEPLSLDAAARFLRSRTGWTPDQTEAERAWTLTAGNPFLLEQVASAMLEGKGVSASLAAGAGQAELLLSRFAGLPERCMGFLQSACVLGTEFRPSVAAEMAMVPADDLDEVLVAISRAGMVGQAGLDRVGFVHPLFCQALYDDLPLLK